MVRNKSYIGKWMVSHSNPLKEKEGKMEEKMKEIEVVKNHPLFKGTNRTCLNQAKTIRTLLSRIKELENERERLSKLLIEARVEIVKWRVGIKEVLEWRNFDGDGISDPLRKELYELIGGGVEKKKDGL